MGFTTPCFIRKNTQELRKKLIELGYKSSRVIDDNEELCLATGLNKYTHITNEMFDSKDPHITWNCAGRIDCGTNEELFLAIAAFRDDIDKNQWFTDGDLWFKCGDEVCNETIEYYLNEYGRKIHKATVDELIEYFKTKEE